jgi:hypothetical protein
MGDPAGGGKFPNVRPFSGRQAMGLVVDDWLAHIVCACVRGSRHAESNACLPLLAFCSAYITTKSHPLYLGEINIRCKI